MKEIYEVVSDYGLVLGVRVIPHGEEVKKGEIIRNSFDHDYENDISSFHSENPVELEGACAIEVSYGWEDEDFEAFKEEIEEAFNFASEAYQGQQIVLIGGESYSWGEDEREIIIEEAKALHIFQ